MFRRGLKIVACLFFLVALFLIGYKAFETTSLEKVEVSRVVDGDTLIVYNNHEEEKVRLLGIDAPESVNPNREANSFEGRMASEHLKSILKRGDIIYLERDRATNDKDKYGRLLRYVWFSNNTSNIENLLNVQLVRDGYAKFNSYGCDGLKYRNEFKKAEKLYQGE